MKIEKSKLKLKKNFDFFLFKQIYKKYILKPNFIFKLFLLCSKIYDLSLTYINIIKNQKNVNIFKN